MYSVIKVPAATRELRMGRTVTIAAAFMVADEDGTTFGERYETRAAAETGLAREVAIYEQFLAARANRPATPAPAPAGCYYCGVVGCTDTECGATPIDLEGFGGIYTH